MSISPQGLVAVSNGLVISGFGAAVGSIWTATNTSGAGNWAATVSATSVSTPTLNAAAITLTNSFTSSIGSFTGPSNSLDLSVFRQQYTVANSNSIAITNFINGPAAGFERSSVLTISNAGLSDIVVYLTAAGIYTDDGNRSYTVSNSSTRKISFNKDDTGYHAVSRSFW